jgi:transposase-like protein
MTNTSLDPIELLRKTLLENSTDFLRQALSQVLKNFMEAEVTDICNAPYDEKSEERKNSRNGYRERDYETRLGTIALSIPKLRKGTYFPSFLEPRRRWEQAFQNVIMESYVQGVSTRKVDELVKAMGGEGISANGVSRISSGLDQTVQAFLSRTFTEGYPYLWLDALYIKMHENSRVVSKAVMLAYGVDEHGNREVLGIEVSETEVEHCWRAFLERLVSQGLRGVQLVISDAHMGLQKAIPAVFYGATWQRCTVHFMRNVLSRIPKNVQGYVGVLLKGIFAHESQEEARSTLRKVVETLSPKYAQAAKLIDDAAEDVLAYMSFPEKHWRQIKSTNPLERQNREIRRRTNVIGIFPNKKAILRLVTTMLMDQNNEWKVDRRYFSLESMQQLLYSKTVKMMG